LYLIFLDFAFKAKMEPDEDYLMSSREFLFEVLSSEVKELEEMKLHSKSYIKNLPKEFSDYDLTNDNLMSLSYGCTVPGVLKSALIVARDSCDEEKPKLKKMQSMYTKAVDQYLESVLEGSNESIKHRKHFVRSHRKWNKSLKDNNNNNNNDDDASVTTIDEHETQSVASTAVSTTVGISGGQHGESETKTNNDSSRTRKKMPTKHDSSKINWKSMNRKQADALLYGKTDHPQRDVLSTATTAAASRNSSPVRGNDDNNNNRVAIDKKTGLTYEIGKKSFWCAITGNVDTDMLPNTTAEKILTHHIKINNLRKNITFNNMKKRKTTILPLSVGNENKNENGDEQPKTIEQISDKKSIIGELDFDFVRGPTLSIPFKPPFWKQFDNTTQGQLKMAKLRKDALKKRHDSTFIVSTAQNQNQNFLINNPVGVIGVSGMNESKVIDTDIRGSTAGSGSMYQSNYDKDKSINNITNTDDSMDRSIVTSATRLSCADIEAPTLAAKTGKQPIKFCDLIKSIPLFYHLTDEQINRFETKCDLVKFIDGELIFSEGDYVGTTYILSQGFISMHKDSTTTMGVKDVLGTLNRGDAFGDTALPNSYENDKRNKSLCTYVATSDDVSAYALPSEIFKRYAYKLNSAINTGGSSILSIDKNGNQIQIQIQGSSLPAAQKDDVKMNDNKKNKIGSPSSSGKMSGSGINLRHNKNNMNNVSVTVTSCQKQELALISHIENYLEFLMLIKNETSGALFDGSQDHIIPNTQREALFGNNNNNNNNGGNISSNIDDNDNIDDNTTISTHFTTNTGTGTGTGTGNEGQSRARSSISALLDKSQKRQQQQSMHGMSNKMNQSHSMKLQEEYLQQKKTNASLFDSKQQQQQQPVDNTTKINDNYNNNTDNNDSNQLSKSEVDHFASIFGQEEDDYIDEVAGTGSSKVMSEFDRAQHAADHEAQLTIIKRKQAVIVDARKRLMLSMLGATSPELEMSETIEVMLALIKDFFHSDRVGIFVIDKIKNKMTLYMSQFNRLAIMDAKVKAAEEAEENGEGEIFDEDNDDTLADSLYIQVPLKGVAGHVAKTGEIICLPDIYDHPLFDRTMDIKTGYRSKQILCVPCFDKSIDGSTVGVLQCMNPTGEATTAKAVEEKHFEELKQKKIADAKSKKWNSKKFKKSKNKKGKKNNKNPLSSTSASALDGLTVAVPNNVVSKSKSLHPHADRHSAMLALNESNSGSDSDDDDDETINTFQFSESDQSNTNTNTTISKSIASTYNINKHGGSRDYSKTDEMLGVMISQLIGTVIGSHKNRIGFDGAVSNNKTSTSTSASTSTTAVTSNLPASFLRKPFSFKLSNVVLQVPDNGMKYGMDISDPIAYPPTIKCTISLYNGCNQMGESQHTSKATRVVHDSTKLTTDATNSSSNGNGTNDNDRKLDYNMMADKHKMRSNNNAFRNNLKGTVISWDIEEMIVFPDVWIRDIPIGARLIIQFYGIKGNPLGWCGMDIFNNERELATGKKIFQLWDGACYTPSQVMSWPIRNNENSGELYNKLSKGIYKFVQFEMQSWDKLVIFAPSMVTASAKNKYKLGNSSSSSNNNNKIDIKTLNLSLNEQIDNLTNDEYSRFLILTAISKGYCSSPLRMLCNKDRTLIWKMRRALIYSTSLLPIFLLSVPWDSSECQYEAYQLMQQWRVQTSENWVPGQSHHTHGYGGVNDNNSSHVMTSRTIALSILYGTTFNDCKIRAYAVIQLLKGLSDDELNGILLPLISSLKYEKSIDNALIRYLLRRAIENPTTIGNRFYWHLKSQISLLSSGNVSSDNPGSVLYYKKIAELYQRKSGDRMRISVGHSELIHTRLAYVCKSILDENAIHKDDEKASSFEAKSNYGHKKATGNTGTNSGGVSEKASIKKRALVRYLKGLQLPSSYDFPCNAHYRVNDIVLDDCCYQKTWPHRSIKLTFRVDEGLAARRRMKKSLNKCEMWCRINVDPSPEKVTLSMLESFDTLWKAYGLDLHVNTYNILHQTFSKNGKLTSDKSNNTNSNTSVNLHEPHPDESDDDMAPSPLSTPPGSVRGNENENEYSSFGINKKSSSSSGNGNSSNDDNGKFHSSMAEVPMHAKSFQDILMTNSYYHDIETQTKTSKTSSISNMLGFTNSNAGTYSNNGISNVKDIGGILSSSPKEYVTLINRDFPDDLIENWLCMQNFENITTRLTSIEANLKSSQANHSTVFEKYYNKQPTNVEVKDEDGDIEVKRTFTGHHRRSSLRNIPSLKTVGTGTVSGVALYEPSPSSYEWRLKFARSLAGWYVSSYVLHIINRTAENIFLLPSGEIFNFELNCLNLEERIALMKQTQADAVSTTNTNTNTSTSTSNSNSTSNTSKGSTNNILNSVSIGSNEPYCPRNIEGSASNQMNKLKSQRLAPMTYYAGYSSLDITQKELESNGHPLVVLPGTDIDHQATSNNRYNGHPDMSEAGKKKRMKNAKKRSTLVSTGIATSARKIGINTGNYINSSASNGSGQPRTHVPLLPCFTRVFGNINSSLFAYFREYALNAFTVLRSHPEFLLQVLKSSLLSIPIFSSSEIAENHIAIICEAMMANLMLEIEIDEEDARNKFSSHLQMDMAFYSQTKGKDSYPAEKRFYDK
jgi:hypothetical protein